MGKDLRVALTGCDGLQNPMGISTKGCRFTWNIVGEGKDVRQKKCRLQIAGEDSFREPVYDESLSAGDTQWELKAQLEEKKRYFWRVSA